MPPVKPAKKHAFGWNCKTCGFFHTVPAPRCAMCGELRGATRQEMVDFVMGKKVAPPVLGNCVELLESPDGKQQPPAAAAKDDAVPSNNPNSSKENRHNHRPPPSLPKQASTIAKHNINPYFKPGNNNNNNNNISNNRGAVRNPYSSTGRPQQMKQPQKQQQENNNSLRIQQKQPYQAQQQQGPPKTNTTNNENKESEMPSTNPTTKQQHHSFFEKTKQTKGRRKSGPPVVRVAFQKGTVEHDPKAAETYIYPKHPDFPTREYQLEITETALNYNTLVSLPTGLGKTHIAAVVMYNYFRWFTSPRGSSLSGKIVFLAPTLPLVHQQIEACYKIMGIPGHETAVLTGKLKASERKELWKTKRVFYCTPQTVQKDIMSACGIQDSKTSSTDEPPEIDPETVTAFSRVVCLVLDEAHKATGDYSYTRVIDLLTTAIQAKFRILGLSATPGKTIQAVQDVITALKACKIEARTDSDTSVAPYLHTKRTEIVVCPRNTSQIQISKKISSILQPLLERLREEGGLQYYGNETMSSYSVLKARQTYEARMRATGQRPHGGLISCFHAAHALVTIRNDCHQQGLGVVKTKIMRLKSMPQRGMMSTIVKSQEFSEAMQMVLEATGDGGLTANVMDPKLAKLCELLKHHFERENACNHSSRAIVFAQFRDAVKEIVDCLESTLKPLVRSRYFVGQNKGSGSNNKDDEKVQGMNQANQQKAIKDFRNNIFNVLVCTSIGEEGLDIGDVDLIINYDVISSPIRTIQRAGRTGRKRDGRVVSLISEGTEERTHKKRLASEKTLVNALKNPKKFTMADHHPMLPNIPLKEYRTMEIKTKLSQVAGQQHTPGMSKKAEAEKKRMWRLDSSEEYERQNLCGDVVSLKEQIAWERLRGFFCKNRVNPMKLQGARRGNRTLLFLGKEDRERLLKKRNKIRRKRLCDRSKGRIEGILESIQRFGPVHFEGTTRSGYRDILSVFPVDPVDEKQKTIPTTVSKKLWGNSNANNHRENLPSSKASEAIPIKNISIPAPKPTTESETITKKLGLGVAAIPSNSDNKAVDTSKLTNMDSEFCQRMPTETAKLQDSSIINEPKCIAPKEAATEATSFRLATPPPSSDDDSSVAPENEENDGFVLPTQSSSSESENDECEVVDRKPIIAQTEVLNPQENRMLSINDKITTMSHQASFEKELFQKQSGTRDQLQKSPENTNDKLVFRFPTPPPSSSSCSSAEEENDDSDTITVPETKPIAGISSENTTCDVNVNKCDVQDLPTSNQFSPSNEHADSIIMNLEDAKFKPAGIVSIRDGRTPKQKVSIGFDDEKDVALSSLKSKSRSKQMAVEGMNNPNDDSDEDVPLISLSNKKKAKSNLSKKLEDDFPLVTIRDKKPIKTKASGNESAEKELPAGVSFGKSPWKDKGGVDDSEEDTPLISLSNKKKSMSKSSKKLTYDIPLIDLCEKKVKNPNQGQHVPLTSGKSEIPDSNNMHLSPDQTSTQNLSQQDIIDHSKSNANRTKRPRILETPDSYVGKLHVDLTSASTQEPSQNEIVDHTKKPFKRLRIGSEDSNEKENDDGGIGRSMDVENTPQPYLKPPPTTTTLASNFLEDTPQTAARDDSNGTRKPSASDFLTDTPIVNTLKNIAEDVVCEFCASGDSTCTNPLILCDGCNLGFHKECYGIKVDIESEEPWYCKSCVASKKNSDQSTSPQPKKLYKKSAKESTKTSKSISWNANATAVGETIDLETEEESPTTKKQQLRERRRQGLAKFVLDEAEMESDQDDVDEEEEVRRIEEEEGAYSQDSFINDNAVLTQHFSQDILGEIDPDASSVGGSNPAAGTPGIDPSSHRALDAQRERENRFKTPNFNRRMMRPNTQDTPSSAQGLGNMNFIRSVLEHHRNGGDCNQIEAEFKRIEASSAGAAENQRSDPRTTATPTNLTRNLNRDNEHIDLTTPPENDGSNSNNGNPVGSSNTSEIERQRRQHQQQQPQQSAGGLTADQLARIEANRQAALRRRAELLAKKRQQQDPR